MNTRIRYDQSPVVKEIKVSRDSFLVKGKLCKVLLFENTFKIVTLDNDNKPIHGEEVKGNRHKLLKRVKEYLKEQGVPFDVEGRNRLKGERNG